MERLANKVALITGAASGIGLATAQHFAREGATVILTGRKLGNLAEARDTLTGPAHRTIPLDVTVEEDWLAAARQVDAAFGRLDILVNNAGYGRPCAITDMALQDWRELIALNLDSVFLGSKHCLPLLARSGNGSIVNVSSIAGLVAMPHANAYGAAKAGVRLLSKITALECAAAGNGVRVNTVFPGQVETPFFTQATDAERLRAVLDRIPLQRIGNADEIAALIAFLASDEARFITAADFVADGGYTAQ